jgi:hypothetical protein
VLNVRRPFTMNANVSRLAAGGSFKAFSFFFHVFS